MGNGQWASGSGSSHFPSLYWIGKRNMKNLPAFPASCLYYFGRGMSYESSTIEEEKRRFRMILYLSPSRNFLLFDEPEDTRREVTKGKALVSLMCFLPSPSLLQVCGRVLLKCILLPLARVEMITSGGKSEEKRERERTRVGSKWQSRSLSSSS